MAWGLSLTIPQLTLNGSGSSPPPIVASLASPWVVWPNVTCSLGW